MHEFETKVFDTNGNPTARVSNDFKIDTKSTPQGNYKQAQFDIACSSGSYKNPQNNTWVKKDPRYFTVRTTNASLIEKIEKKCKKGVAVYLTGTPNAWSMKMQDGTYKNGFYISLDKDDELVFFDLVKESKEEVEQTPPVNDVDISNEDLPFDF